MKPLRRQIEEKRAELNVPWNILEQDFVLSWMLAGISQIEALRDFLVFKGGTALKKAYFGNYRFSEDLDFTMIKPLSDKELSHHITQACQYAVDHISTFVPDPFFESKAYKEKQPHAHGQVAFTIRARLPWHRDPHVNIMIEITRHEEVLAQPKLMPLIYDYESEFPYKIWTYSLEEIVCEKLRAILQNVKKLHEMGWTRSRVRDYYDLWRILSFYGESLNRQEILEILPRKCAAKDVSWSAPDDFFQESYLRGIRDSWDKWLAPLVADLPPCEDVLENLKILLNALLLSTPISENEQNNAQSNV